METATAKQHSHTSHRPSKKHHQQHRHPDRADYFSLQKNFGDWTNLLEPPITLAEVLSKITVTPNAPDGFISGLEKEYGKQLTAMVVTARS